MENGATTPSDYFIESICSYDVGILVGLAPTASLAGACAKLDAAAIGQGRVPSVRPSCEAEVVCACTARLEFPSTVVGGSPGANRECVGCHCNGCNDRKDGYESDHW